MRIKRFNEALDDEKGIIGSYYKEIDGEIWISKSDLVRAFNALVKETESLKTKMDLRENANLTNGQLLDQLILLIKTIKNTLKNIGSKPNPLDPYGEEEWEDD